MDIRPAKPPAVTLEPADGADTGRAPPAPDESNDVSDTGDTGLLPDDTGLAFDGAEPAVGSGGKTYVIFVMTGSDWHGGADDAMFEQAAATRAQDIRSSPDFDPSRDRIERRSIQELGQIGPELQGIKANNDAAGRDTVEVDIISHGGTDGPIGARDTSSDPLPEWAPQMSMEGWRKLDFDWAPEGSRLILHGCNTGPGFGKRLSAEPNMAGVEVWGQSASSFPSQYADRRSLWQVPTATDALSNPESWAPYSDRLYMVADQGGRGTDLFFESFEAKPMAVSRDGQALPPQAPPGRPAPTTLSEWFKSWFE